jgi:hypothetical protein
MRNPVNEARAGVQRYWVADGLMELHFGVVLLLVAGMLATVHGALRSPGRLLVWLGFFLLQIALALSARRLHEAIRQRITYRRSGYVRVPEMPKRLRVLVVAVAGLLPFVGFGILYWLLVHLPSISRGMSIVFFRW